jgi:hypothetical protein
MGRQEPEIKLMSKEDRFYTRTHQPAALNLHERGVPKIRMTEW